MLRLYFNNTISDPQNIEITDKEIIKKITKVMRLQIGDNFLIYDINAEEYEVQIIEISLKKVKCRLISKLDIDRELDTEINLYMALLKKDKFEWVVQKTTEIGVKKIIPIVTEHCVLKELSKNKIQRYKKIITEATMQCGGKINPELTDAIQYDQAVRNLNIKDLNLIAHEAEQENKLIDKIKKNKTINLFIGPEGGFSDFEIDLAKQNSLISVSLGKRILRAETAAIVGCGAIAQCFY